MHALSDACVAEPCLVLQGPDAACCTLDRLRVAALAIVIFGLLFLAALFVARIVNVRRRRRIAAGNDSSKGATTLHLLQDRIRY